jgi:hypothetical protein
LLRPQFCPEQREIDRNDEYCVRFRFQWTLRAGYKHGGITSVCLGCREAMKGLLQILRLFT